MYCYSSGFVVKLITAKYVKDDVLLELWVWFVVKLITAQSVKDYVLLQLWVWFALLESVKEFATHIIPDRTALWLPQLCELRLNDLNGKDRW